MTTTLERSKRSIANLIDFDFLDECGSLPTNAARKDVLFKALASLYRNALRATPGSEDDADLHEQRCYADREALRGLIREVFKEG